jgi:hypothetical protein
MRRVLVAVAAIVAGLVAAPAGAFAVPAPAAPPLATSANVSLVTTIPGSFAGMVFKDHYAFATGWATGLTVFDIAVPAAPTPVAALALPHFENEDVDLCGNTLLITNDRAEADYGGALYVIDIAVPTAPGLLAILPLGLTGEGRGPGHIANFVKADCTQAWIDGGDDVEVIDLTNRAAPASLGSFRSRAATGPDPANPGAFVVSHDTERDSTGTLWSVGGGGVAGYKLTADPLQPQLVAASGLAGVNIDFDGTDSPYNDFILHNTERVGTSSTLLVTEEDYIDTDEEQPGSCNGQGKFETWKIVNTIGAMKPLDTWQTELDGFLTGGGADSKAPVTINCSSHWFDYRSGVAAVGWYEQGVRFLDVRNPKNIRQIGYYLPADGSTWAAYWVPTATDLVYTADVTRGLDVIRITNASDPAAPPVTAPILDVWFGVEGTVPGVPGFTPAIEYGWSCAIQTG